MVSFVRALLDFEVFWTNSCCDRARQKPTLGMLKNIRVFFYFFCYIIDAFVKLKADRKREFDDAMTVAKAKKARLVEAERAEKKYLEGVQKRNRHGK